MMREVVRSKIHKATVTDANPDYIGSITIEPALILVDENNQFVKYL